MNKSQNKQIAMNYINAKTAYNQAAKELDEYVDLYMDLYFDYENDLSVMDALNTLVDNKANNLEVSAKREAMMKLEDAVLDTAKVIVNTLSGASVLKQVMPAFETKNLSQRRKVLDWTIELLLA